MARNILVYSADEIHAALVDQFGRGRLMIIGDGDAVEFLVDMGPHVSGDGWVSPPFCVCPKCSYRTKGNVVRPCPECEREGALVETELTEASQREID